MRILITLQRRRTHRYLINIVAKSFISEVRDLIGSQEYGRALGVVYDKGLLEREVHEHELPVIEADLILSECSANWDVKKRT